MRVQGVWFSLVLTACAASVASVPPPESPPTQTTPSETIAERETRAESRVNVHGIEGSLSNDDVRRTMDKRGRAFGACHEPSARRMPRLSGSIEFAIRVSAEGSVQQVDVRASDLGDRELERCFADVIASTPFPRPNGGVANITWRMMLGPASPGPEPEQWGERRVQRVLSKRLPELSESCELPKAGAFIVTAYVNRSGRVVAAGVSAREETEPELLDCIAQALQSWRMPSPKKGSLAKVSFPVRGTGL